MRKFLFAGAAMLLGAALGGPALAEGPRASSENHWPGMQGAQLVPQYATGSVPEYTVGLAPHYVLQQGYDRGGKWHSHWELIQ